MSHMVLDCITHCFTADESQQPQEAALELIKYLKYIATIAHNPGFSVTFKPKLLQYKIRLN